MPKKLFISAILTISALLGAVKAYSQELPQLPVSPEITRSKLANGIDCYLVSSSSHKGYADFALVWKGTQGDGDTVRQALDSLPHFLSVTPYRFLSDCGVGYTRRGEVECAPSHTTYRFKDVPVGIPSVRDSTILMLMDIAARSPFGPAIVISGDIDPSAVTDRLSAISLTLTPRLPAKDIPDYVWVPDSVRHIKYIQTFGGDAASLRFTYRSPRTATALLNTIQPILSRTYARALGDMIRERVKYLFKEQGIALVDVDFEYVDAAGSDSDETFSITLTTGVDCIREACAAVGSILSSLDADGATIDEYTCARMAEVSALRSSAGQTNAEYVDKCISAYLYGTDLSSPQTLLTMLSGKVMDTGRELGFFNEFVSAMLDADKNLTIDVLSPRKTVSEVDLGDVFAAGWRDRKPAPVILDTDLYSRYHHVQYEMTSKPKIKIKTVAQDAMTGGEMWTFSNGIKVLYKQTDASRGIFSYAFMVKGGYASVKDLARGEGAFVSDMFSLCSVAGMDWMDFCNMLKSKGISINPEVNMSDMRITGTASSDRLELVLDAIISIARDRRQADRDEFDYYRKCETIREEVSKHGPDGITAVVDSMLSPDFKYESYKSVSNLGDDLPQRSEVYFTGQLSRFNDGLIVLIGDLDAVTVKRILCQYLSELPVGQVFQSRSVYQYTQRSGSSTYAVSAPRDADGNPDISVTVAVSAMQPYTTQKYASFLVAGEYLRKAVTQALCDMGYWAEVTGSYDIYPAEKTSFTITCRPVEVSGLPSGVTPAEPKAVLEAVKSVIDRTAEARIDPRDMELFKADAASRVASALADPSLLTALSVTRYSQARDLVTGLQDRIKVVNSVSIKSVLKTVCGGTRVEYVMY